MSLHVLISTHGLQTKVMKKYFTKSCKIEFIDLSRNQIKYIEKESFSNLSYLQEIDLSNNRISSLKWEMFLPENSTRLHFRPGNNNIPVIRVRSNPIFCDCQLWNLAQNILVFPIDDHFACIFNQTYIGKTKIDFSSSSMTCANENVFIKLCSPIERTTQKQTTTDAPSNTAESKPRKLDVSLMLIMAAWFIMVYIGINKFIRDNMLDKDMCMEYNLFDSTNIPT